MNKTLILIAMLVLSGCAVAPDLKDARISGTNCSHDTIFPCVMTGNWVKTNPATFKADHEICLTGSERTSYKPVIRTTVSCGSFGCSGSSSSGYSRSHYVSGENYQACMYAKGHERACATANECQREYIARGRWERLNNGE